MQSYEIRLTAVWVAWCYFLLGAGILFSGYLKPEALVPKVEFVANATDFTFDAEKLSNLIRIPVKLDRPRDRSLSVTWSSNEILPACVTALKKQESTQVDFLAGSKDENIELKVDWSLVEKPISIDLSLKASDEFLLGERANHQITIKPKRSIKFEFSKEDVREGLDKYTTLTAKPNYPLDQDYQIDFTLPREAKLLQLPPPPYTIKANQASQEWQIQIGDDDEAIGNRSFRMSFRDINSGDIDLPNGIFLNLIDDEKLRTLTFQVSSSYDSLKEDDPSRVVEITGTLNEPVGDSEVIVSLAFDGTATQDQDYKVLEPQLVFKNNSVAKIRIQAMNDNRFDPNEFILVRPIKHKTVKVPETPIRVPLIDESKIKLYVKQTPARLIAEAKEAEFAFAIEPEARNLPGVSYPAVRFQILGSSEEDKDLLGRLEVKNAKKVSREGEVPTYEFSLDGGNQSKKIKVAYPDDKVYRGSVSCQLVFDSKSYRLFDGKRQAMPKSSHLVELVDNDTLPMKISLSGKSMDYEGQNVFVLDEMTPTDVLELTVELEQQMNRDIEVPLYFIGHSGTEDLVFPEGKPLVQFANQPSDQKTVHFASGQSKVVIPIRAKDDEALEGNQFIKIRTNRDKTEGQLQLLIKDDDDCKISVKSGPFDIVEGDQAELVVQLLNAPDGVTLAIDLSVGATDTSTGSLDGAQKDVEIFWQGQESTPLDPSNFKFPARTRQAKLIVKALNDSDEEGDEVLNLRFKLSPEFETGHYKIIQPNAFVRIHEVPLQEDRIVVIPVNQRTLRLWPLLRGAYSKFVDEAKDQLLGGGLLLVGKDGESVLWDGKNKELPVVPLEASKSEEMLSLMFSAVEKQDFNRDVNMRVVVFWAAESSDVSVAKFEVPKGIAAHFVIGMPENGQGATLIKELETALQLNQAGAKHMVDSISPPLRDSTVIDVFRKSFKEKP